MPGKPGINFIFYALAFLLKSSHKYEIQTLVFIPVYHHYFLLG